MYHVVSSLEVAGALSFQDAKCLSGRVRRVYVGDRAR